VSDPALREGPGGFRRGSPKRVSCLRGPPGLIGGASYPPLVTSESVLRFRFGDPRGIALYALRMPKMG
jgi:hypothetical protein